MAAGYDVVIVGSGFGGGVCAARLAARGMRTLVLERGPWWGPAGVDRPMAERRDFPRGPLGVSRLVRNVRWARDGRHRDVTVRRDGLAELHVFDHLTAVTASGVGGGSLIYTSMQVEPPPWLYDALPPEITPDELHPYVDAVRAMLSPAPLPPPRVPGRTASFARAASAAGLGAVTHPDLAVDHARCVGCGSCVVGCDHGAKTTVDRAYVPLALRHGAEVRPLCEVVAVGPAPDGWRWSVRYRDHRTGGDWAVEAPRVVLAAGTLGTLRLLLSARDHHRTLPRLPRRLGLGFSGNGDVGALLRRGTDADPAAPDAPTVSAVVPREGGGRRWVLGEVGLPWRALPLPAAARRALADVSMVLAMGDEAGGEVTWQGGLESALSRADDDALYAAIDRDAASLAARQDAEWFRASVALGDRRRALATVHPVGGAAIGRSSDDGVVDHRGEVFGHAGLYVADGALYPRAPGVPPSLGIAALAERVAALMD